MSLVLEHEDPVLKLAVDVYLDLNGTSVDLLRLVKVGEKSVSLELLCSKSTDIHKSYRAVAPAELLADIEVHIVSVLDVGSLDIDLFNVCEECGVTAVVRPVGVYHSDLSYGRIAVLLVAEVVLTELDIVVVHSETELVHKCVETDSVELCEALEHLNSCGDLVISIERLYSVE